MRTVHLLGVPLRSGSLYPGNENDAQAYRDIDLVGRLQEAGCEVVDDGDVAIPSYLPHHAVAPIRSWPGPRIVWDCVSERVARLVQTPGRMPLLIGCDCSVVVGTTQALARQRPPGGVHVLYIDGDFDDAAPNAHQCQSAAAVAVWLLMNESPFWAGPILSAPQVTVIGPSAAATSPGATPRALPLSEVRRMGPEAAAQHALAGVREDARIVVHLDIDVFAEAAIPAAYFPHHDGLTRAEGAALLRALLHDPRSAVVEVAEYAALRDRNQESVTALAEILTEGLRP
jgi:arginase family enzyme